MDAEFDYDLSTEQWEVLKALRLPAPARGRISTSALEQLIVLALASIDDGLPCITPVGRKVLIRGGSSRLLDVAA